MIPYPVLDTMSIDIDPDDGAFGIFFDIEGICDDMKWGYAYSFRVKPCDGSKGWDKGLLLVTLPDIYEYAPSRMHDVRLLVRDILLPCGTDCVRWKDRDRADIQPKVLKDGTYSYRKRKPREEWRWPMKDTGIRD